MNTLTITEAYDNLIFEIQNKEVKELDFHNVCKCPCGLLVQQFFSVDEINKTNIGYWKNAVLEYLKNECINENTINFMKKLENLGFDLNDLIEIENFAEDVFNLGSLDDLIEILNQLKQKYVVETEEIKQSPSTN